MGCNRSVWGGKHTCEPYMCCMIMCEGHREVTASSVMMDALSPTFCCITMSTFTWRQYVDFQSLHMCANYAVIPSSVAELNNPKDLMPWIRCCAMLQLLLFIYQRMKSWMPCCWVLLDLDWTCVLCLPACMCMYDLYVWLTLDRCNI